MSPVSPVAMSPAPSRTAVATTRQSTTWHESSRSRWRSSPATRAIRRPVVTTDATVVEDPFDGGIRSGASVDLGQDYRRDPDEAGGAPRRPAHALRVDAKRPATDRRGRRGGGECPNLR